MSIWKFYGTILLGGLGVVGITIMLRDPYLHWIPYAVIVGWLLWVAERIRRDW